MRGEGVAGTIEIVALEGGLRAIEECRGFLFFEIGNQLGGQSVRWERREEGIDESDGLFGATVTDLRADSGELSLATSDEIANARSFSASELVRLNIRGRRSGRDAARLGNFDIHHGGTSVGRNLGRSRDGARG